MQMYYGRGYAIRQQDYSYCPLLEVLYLVTLKYAAEALAAKVKHYLFYFRLLFYTCIISFLCLSYIQQYHY